MPSMHKNKPIGMRISATGVLILDQLARSQGISKTAVIEITLREAARAKGITIPEEPRTSMHAGYDPSKDSAYSGEWTGEDMRDFTTTSMRHFDEEDFPNASV